MDARKCSSTTLRCRKLHNHEKGKTMKNLLLSIFCLVNISLYAQAPEAFNFQGVLRDASGAPLSHHPCNFRISILQGSSSGTAAYVETDAVTTNAGGLFTIVVGRGTVTSGAFSTIDWGHGPYFLDVELDTSGNTNYKPLSNTEIISVPYALYAKTAGSVVGSSTSSGGACLDTVAAAGILTFRDTLNVRYDTVTHAPAIDTLVSRNISIDFDTIFYNNLTSLTWNVKTFRNGNLLIFGGGSGLSIHKINVAGADYGYGASRFVRGDNVEFQFIFEEKGCKKMIRYSLTL